MNEIFSTSRYWFLIRSHAVGAYRSLVTLTATLAIVISFMALLGDKLNDEFYISLFGAMLFILGLVFTSRAFRQLHDKTRNTAYLLIPASSFEKTLASYFVVTVGLVAYLLILTCVVSVVVEPLNTLLTGQQRPVFNPFAPDVWVMIPGYLFVQSSFFLGAAWFRKGHLMKTILVHSLASVAITIFILLVMGIALEPYWSSSQDVDIKVQDVFGPYAGAIKTLVYGLAALWVVFCWYVAWLRVRETQVSDGV